MKKYNIITVCIIIVTIIISSFACLAEVMEEELSLATGLIYEDVEAPSLFDLDSELKNQLDMLKQQNQKQRSGNESDGLASVVDLSTSEYFPPIASQGDLGTCAAFAATYYQFTYMKNEFLEIESTYQNAASPQATYNLVYNKSKGSGSTILSNYKVLKHIGAPTLSQFPYLSKNQNWNRWVNDINVQREALNVRLENYYCEELDTAQNPITYSDDWDLMQIKYLLGAGYPLVFGTCLDYESEGSSFGEIIFRGNYNVQASHAMTVVGYNDNVYFDVNGNNSIEDAERGAFKVANSHGTGYGNNGYIWVLYDAINVTSQIPGNWESEYTCERNPFFSGSESDVNELTYIRVNNTKPLFVGELTVTASKPDKFFASNSTNYTLLSNPNQANSSSFVRLYDGRGEQAFSGKLLFPFNDELFTSETEIHSMICRLSVSDTTFNSAEMATSISYRITDNLGNTINSHGIVSLGSTVNNYSKIIQKKFFIDAEPSATEVSGGAIKLDRGDVNFDGVINSTDSSFILSMAVNNVEYSYAQEFLADANKDGIVNARDALAIM